MSANCCLEPHPEDLELSAADPQPHPDPPAGLSPKFRLEEDLDSAGFAPAAFRLHSGRSTPEPRAQRWFIRYD